MDTQSTKFHNKNTYNAIAEDYEANYGVIPASLDFAEYIVDKVKKLNNPRILDLGCGGGNLLQFFENKLPNASLIGVDFSSKLLTIAKSKLKHTQLVCEDFATFEDKSRFDVIIATFSLIHSTDDELTSLIPKIFDMLNDDGYLYVSFILGTGEKFEPEALNPDHKTYFNFHSKNDIEKHFQDNRFHILKEKVIHSQDQYEDENDLYLILTK